MAQIKTIKCCGFAMMTLLFLVGCQQTPGMNPHKASERAAYSEWNCEGNPMLAQFYGSRVVISDSSNSHWLDRSTQVGQVFSNEYYQVSFSDEQVEWQRPESTVVCTPRDLPDNWQRVNDNSRQSIDFIALGTINQSTASQNEGAQTQQWQFILQGGRAQIELKEAGNLVEQQEFASGEADYYMDMWTYQMQTADERMRVQITDGLCRNQRDQIPYPSSVQINWNDQALLGCGRWVAKGNYRP